MIKTNVKTEYNGLVWCHEKYITACREEGKSFLISYNDKIMTITPELIAENPPKQGEDSFMERFGREKGKRYYLYGFKFIADDDQARAQLKAKRNAGDMISQCPECLSIKIAISLTKTTWQGSIVSFPKLPAETCLKCK